MKKIHFGTGFAIFILFFGIAVVEAIQKKDWLRIFFWISMGFVFLLADNIKRRKNIS